jgi:transposase InsO family protein
MKLKRFSDEQIIEILRQHEARAKPADLCRQHGISGATLYNWRRRLSSYRYRSRWADDGPLRERLRALAGLRRRFGYRPLGGLLECDGVKVNLKKIYRLYREESLAAKRRRGRQRAIGTRAPIIVLEVLNQRWSLDFVSDQLANSRRFRLLNVIDDFNSERLATVPDFCLSGLRFIRKLGSSWYSAAIRRCSALRADPKSKGGGMLRSIQGLRAPPRRTTSESKAEQTQVADVRVTGNRSTY